jgi:hypothetical protein
MCSDESTIRSAQPAAGDVRVRRPHRRCAVRVETGGVVSPLDLLWLCLIVISLQPPISARASSRIRWRQPSHRRPCGRGSAGLWSRTAAQPT